MISKESSEGRFHIFLILHECPLYFLQLEDNKYKVNLSNIEAFTSSFFVLITTCSYHTIMVYGIWYTIMLYMSWDKNFRHCKLYNFAFPYKELMYLLNAASDWLWIWDGGIVGPEVKEGRLQIYTWWGNIFHLHYLLWWYNSVLE